MENAKQSVSGGTPVTYMTGGGGLGALVDHGDP